MSFLRHRRKHFRDAGSDWPDGDGYIYKEGLYEDEWVAGYSAGTATQGKDATNLWIAINILNSTAEKTWVSDGPVYLTASDKIKIDWQKGAGGTAAIVVSTDKNGSYTVYTARLTATDVSFRVVAELSLSGIASGDYYIRAHYVVPTKTNVNSTLRVYNIYKE